MTCKLLPAIGAGSADIVQERAPGFIVGRVPTVLADRESTCKFLPDIDAGSADIVQERAPFLNVGRVATELKDLERLASSCRA